MKKFEVENKADFVSSWITYLSTATGILKSMGKDVDLVDVAGYTGYAFHLNTSKGDTCPSAPTVAPFSTFAEGLESFGWKVEQSWEYPDFNPSDDDKQNERAKNYFEEIKNTVTQFDRPIGIWGVPNVPEFGIVNGFDDDKYVVSTFRSLPSMPLDDDPIPYLNLHAPGGLFKMIFKRPIDIKIDSVLDKEALSRAVAVAQGIDKLEKYVSGPESFDEWALILESGIVPESEDEIKEMTDITKLNYHGNSYVAACTQEGLDLAAAFLERLTERYQGQSFCKKITQASENYRQAAAFMKEYAELFPFSLDKNWNPDEFPDGKRYQGARFLRKAKPLVVKAIAQMEDALKKWK
ncbi:MAG: hypothetical protein KAQ65_11275 [Candidatus Thorarchaeota archaeon]|nr:hypothetical protein [Candidatus Thorarchaeota archaeon]